MAKVNALRNLIEGVTRGARGARGARAISSTVAPKVSAMASRTNAGGNKMRTAGKLGLALAGGAGGYGLRALENRIEADKKEQFERPQRAQRLKELEKIKRNLPEGVFISEDNTTYGVMTGVPNADLIMAGLRYLTQDIPPKTIRVNNTEKRMKKKYY